MSSRNILFPMSPNPTVEQGLDRPTNQPRALDLGDVGKEVKEAREIQLYLENADFDFWLCY